MQQRLHTERFHDLDALRAWAMLLGVVLHAAWMMTPVYWGSPIHDCDGGYFPQWVVWFIHMFRLQAFFLIAGLFAHLVFRRQGAGGFIKHRLTRIGIPLAVGCLIIYPIWFLQDTWAGILRGRIQTTESFWSVFQTQIGRSYREVLDTFHLWFLYDLLLVYAFTLIVIFVFRYVIDRGGWLRDWMNRGFRRLMQSAFLLVFLTIPSAFLLMPSKFWSGIEAYPVWFRPDWSGVILYWIFFAVGWYLYANLDLLAIVQRAWVQRLAIGTVLSIAMFAVYMGYVSRERNLQLSRRGCGRSAIHAIAQQSVGRTRPRPAAPAAPGMGGLDAPLAGVRRQDDGTQSGRAGRICLSAHRASRYWQTV